MIAQDREEVTEVARFVISSIGRRLRTKREHENWSTHAISSPKIAACLLLAVSGRSDMAHEVDTEAFLR